MVQYRFVDSVPSGSICVLRLNNVGPVKLVCRFQLALDGLSLQCDRIAEDGLSLLQLVRIAGHKCDNTLSNSDTRHDRSEINSMRRAKRREKKRGQRREEKRGREVE